MPDGAEEPGGGPPDGAVPPAQTPLGLDYFEPPKAQRRLSQSVELGVALAVVGWLPFACGIINVMVASNTYSTAVAGSHKGGAVLFLAAGVVTSAVGLWRLLTLRHTAGVVLAVLVVTVQLLVVSCLGAAYLSGR